MRRSKAELQIVDFFHRLHIKSSIVKKVKTAEPRPNCRFKNIPGILEPIHVTDFVAVKCRDRHLDDAKFLQYQLNDDFGVEMEIVRIFLKRNLTECFRAIQSIARMK